MNWAYGRPRTNPLYDQLNEDCVNLSATKNRNWVDSRCDLEYRYICKKETVVNGYATRIVPPIFERPKVEVKEPVEPEPVELKEEVEEDPNIRFELDKEKATKDALAANGRNQAINAETAKAIRQIELLALKVKDEQAKQNTTSIVVGVVVGVVILIGLSILGGLLARYYYCKPKRDTEVHMQKAGLKKQ